MILRLFAIFHSVTRDFLALKVFHGRFCFLVGAVHPCDVRPIFKWDETPLFVPSSDPTLRAWPAVAGAGLHTFSYPVQEDREARGSVSRSDPFRGSFTRHFLRAVPGHPERWQYLGLWVTTPVCVGTALSKSGDVFRRLHVSRLTVAVSCSVSHT